MKLKGLIEKRNAKVEEAQGLVTLAETETRAFSDDESTKWTALMTEIRQLDETIKAIKDSEKLENRDLPTDEKQEDVEVREFAEFIRGNTEVRANFAKTDNGVVIPQTIANKIITKVKDICPILSLATTYHVKGKLVVPVWGDQAGGENITCAYATEFTDLTSKSGKFTSVELTGYLAGALTKVSKSLLNNSDFNLVSFIVSEMAKSIAEFLEKELIQGTSGKMTGVLSATQGITAESATAITSDEVIKLQDTLKDVFQKNAVWLMHRETRTALRLLKDSNGQYILNKDITSPFGYTLLGRPIYVSDSMPKIAAGAKAIVYGDMSGLTVNVTEQVDLQILQEVYAAQHALGVVGWVEADSKITDVQKISVLTMKAA